MDSPNLSSDIISEILSHDRQLILTGRRLSREISQKLDPIYIRQFCLRPITQKEIHKYYMEITPRNMFIVSPHAASAPYPLGIIITIITRGYQNYMAEEMYTVYLEDPKQFDDEHPVEPGEKYIINGKAIENVSLEPRLLSTVRLSTHNYYPNIINSQGELDLLTTYRILKRRLGCVNVNPRFAKEAVIDRFNQIVNLYLNHPSQTRILDLYLYLMAHAVIFNFPIQFLNEYYEPNFDESEDEDEDEDRYWWYIYIAINKDRNPNDPNYIDQPTTDEKNIRRLATMRKNIHELIIKIREYLNKFLD